MSASALPETQQSLYAIHEKNILLRHNFSFHTILSFMIQTLINVISLINQLINYQLFNYTNYGTLINGDG